MTPDETDCAIVGRTAVESRRVSAAGGPLDEDDQR
jgi:hypothetical protein